MTPAPAVTDAVGATSPGVLVVVGVVLQHVLQEAVHGAGVNHTLLSTLNDLLSVLPDHSPVPSTQQMLKGKTEYLRINNSEMVTEDSYLCVPGRSVNLAGGEQCPAITGETGGGYTRKLHQLQTWDSETQDLNLTLKFIPCSLCCASRRGAL